ncbi:MAG: J domain-containing protein [Acidobacteria bacterium]|nr:J domain-containing protein [Acidobacteriota bacterium]MBI3263563.1 J domain-containing protein [Acidobacteriota bacterium]
MRIPTPTDPESRTPNPDMDLYAVLGLKRGVPDADIKRAFRRLARRYHPNINPGDKAAELRFRQIAQAYDILTDPARRRKYEEQGLIGEQVEVATFGFAGFDFTREPTSGSSASTFGDLFAEVFQHRRGPQPGPAPERGADLHTTVEVSFEESMRGVERSVTVLRRETCRTCRGSGARRTAETRCPRCEGSGILRSARGHMLFTKACGVCGGTGFQAQVRCDVCAGQGVEAHSETFGVEIPAGVSHGERIRVPGNGNGGWRGGPAGDLWVAVQVATDSRFRREGDDLHLLVPIAIQEAALGAKIEIRTVDGVARVRIPPGTQSGQRFRLRERGAPSSRDGRRGDLIVEVRLMLPPILDERSKDLLRQFGRINGDYARETPTT